MASSKFGVLHVFARTGVKYTVVPLSLTNLTIGSDYKAHVKVCRDEVDPIHCIIKVQNNGLALLVNMSKKNPVPINDKAVPKEMYLLPGDIFSIVGKTFKYENSSLAAEDLTKARKWNYDKLNKCKRATLGRNLLTPQPEKTRIIRPRRSASMDNETELPERARKPLGRFVRVLPGTKMVAPPAKTAANRCLSGFTVSTPKSAVKPSLRNSTIFKNLTKMDYVEPECDASSSTSQRQETLKTPVTDLLAQDDGEVATTPLNNTTVVIVNSPLREDKTSLRSRKSKAKNIAIQRLTHNDESVIVLQTSDSKTPKSALKTTSNIQIANISKTKLLDEFSDSESDSSNATPKKSDALDSLGEIPDIDDSVECSLAEEEELLKSDSESGGSSDLKPSRKAESSFFVEDIVASSTETTSDMSTLETVGNTNKHADTDKCSKSLDFKAHVSSTPLTRSSTKNLNVSFTTDAGTTEFTNDAETTELDTTTASDVIIGEKRKRSDNSSSEDIIKKKVKTDECVFEMKSFSSQDLTNENECHEGSDENPQTPEPSTNIRKALTEPKQIKKVVTRRSLSDRISNQENEPVLESNNTTCETVDTSSFVYVKNNVSFENTDFPSPVTCSTDNLKKAQKEPLNDLTDVAGVKKLLQTPRATKEHLNDLSSPVGVKRLLRTPKIQKELSDVSMSGIKTLMKSPVQESKSKIDCSDEDASVTNVFNVSGISNSQDEDDIFPVKKVTRTYGKSPPATNKNTSFKRKSVGKLVDVSPEVEKWVEESTAHLSRDDVSEINEQCDLQESPAKETPVKSTRKSIRVNLNLGENEENSKIEVQWGKTGISSVRRSRGRSLPVRSGTKIVEKTRKTEGVTCIDLENAEGSDVDQDDTVTGMDEEDANVQDASAGNGIEASQMDDSVISLDSTVDLYDEPVLNNVNSDSVLETSQGGLIPGVEELVTRNVQKSVAKGEETSDIQEVVQALSSIIPSEEEAILNEIYDDDSEEQCEIHLVEEKDTAETPYEESTSAVFRTSSRKSMKVDAIEKIDNQVEEDNTEISFSGRKSVRESMNATSDAEQTDDKFGMPKSNKKSLNAAKLPDTDVTSRKSLRKAHLKSVELDDAEDKTEEYVIRKCIRKSAKSAELAPESIVSRKSSTRNLSKAADVAIDIFEGPAVQDKTTNATNDENEQNSQSMVPVMFEVSEGHDEKIAATSRKGIKKSTMVADMIKYGSNEVMNENDQEPVSRESMRKSIKTKNVSTDMDEEESQPMESTGDFEEAVAKSVTTSRKSARKSTIVVDVAETDFNKHMSENDHEPISRKSMRKSKKTKNVSNDENEQENQPIVDNEVLAEPASKSTATPRKSTRKSTVVADVVESDSSEAMSKNVQEPVTRESMRKSVKTKSARNDEVEQENQPMVDVDNEVLQEPASKSVTSRKSMRKSTVVADVVESDSSETMCKNDQTPVSRKSMRKSIKTVSTDIDEEENQPMEPTDNNKDFEGAVTKSVTTSRKSAKKSSVVVDVVETDSNEHMSKNDQESVSRKSMRKSIKTKSAANDGDEQDNQSMVDVDNEGLEELVSKSAVTSRKSMRKSTVVRDLVEPDSSEPISEIVLEPVSRKSMRQSMKTKRGSNDEDEQEVIVIDDTKDEVSGGKLKTTLRKSTRKSSALAVNMESDYNEPVIEKVQGRVPRKSVRKSLKTTPTNDVSKLENELIDSNEINAEVSSENDEELKNVSESNEGELISEEGEHSVDEIVTPVSKSRKKSFKSQTTGKLTESSRKNIKKADIIPTTPNKVDTDAFTSRKSSRKSIKYEDESRTEEIETPVSAVSRSSSRKSLLKFATAEEDDNKDEVIKESSARKSTRKTSDDISEETERVLVVKSVGKSKMKETRSSQSRKFVSDSIEEVPVANEPTLQVKGRHSIRKSKVAEIVAEVIEIIDSDIPKSTKKSTVNEAKFSKKLMKTVQLAEVDDIGQVIERDSVEKGKSHTLGKPKRSRQQKEPKNDLSNLLGVKQLFAQQKERKEPRNDLTDIEGVAELMAEEEPPMESIPERDSERRKLEGDEAASAVSEAFASTTKESNKLRSTRRKGELALEGKKPTNKRRKVMDVPDDNDKEDGKNPDAEVKQDEPKREKKEVKKVARSRRGQPADTKDEPEVESVGGSIVKATKRTKGKTADRDEVEFVTEEKVESNDDSADENIEVAESQSTNDNEESVKDKLGKPTIRTRRGQKAQKVEVPENKPAAESDSGQEEQDTESVTKELKPTTRSKGRRELSKTTKAEFAATENIQVPKRSRRALAITTSETLQEGSQTDDTEITDRPTRSRRGKQESKSEDSATKLMEVSGEITPVVEREIAPEASAKKIIRGRRAKRDDDASTPKVDPATKPPTVRRGKKVMEEDTLVEDQLEKPKRGGRRAKIETEEVIEVDKEPETPVEKAVPPKRGGRRAKLDIEEVPEMDKQLEIPIAQKTPAKRGGRRGKIDTEEVSDESEILVEKAAPPKRGGRRAKIDNTEEVSDFVKEPETDTEKAAPIKRSGRRGRVVATNDDASSSTEPTNKKAKRGQKSEAASSDESVKPKRGRKAAEPVQTEVEEVVTKKKTVKGVTVTTVTVNKKVTFDMEAPSNGIQMEFTPKPRVGKRRLKSEDEMNTSDPIAPKKTRSRN